MEIFDNKFEAITKKWIANYIDELYEPYKLYGTIEEVNKIGDRFNSPSKYYNEKNEKTYIN